MNQNDGRHFELPQGEQQSYERAEDTDDSGDHSTTSTALENNENGQHSLGLRNGVVTDSLSVNTDSTDGLLCTRSGWKVLFFGQALSFLLAAGGASQATLHLQCNLSAPTFTSSIIYFILSLHTISLYKHGRRLRRRQQQQCEAQQDGIVVLSSLGNDAPRYWFCGMLPLQASPWAYLGIAFLDVEANYMTVLAYRFTTITSITLFDALAIPSAMLLSAVFLKRKYTGIHYCGVVVCMAGVIYNVLADYESNLYSKNGSKEYPHKLLGDVLAMLGGIFYGCNDFLAETAVRTFGGPTEFLGMNGLFGLIISIIQAAVLERDEILAFFQGGNACSVTTGLGLLLAYALTNSLSYVGASRFLLISEAAFLNLSFLTGDFWSLGFSVIAERIVPSPLFFVALVLTISGVVIYEMGPSTVVEQEEVKYENVGRREPELSDVSNGGSALTS